MKTILPWLLVVAFGAAAASFYISGSAKDRQLDSMHAQIQEMDAVRTKADELQKQVTEQTEQIASMQKDNAELLKLRGQVRQMTDENAKLQKQVATAQTQAERSQAEVQQVQARVAENAKAMAEQQVLQARQNAGAANACINNLRLIDGAKQQWALEKNKTADDIPQPQDLLPYLGRNAQFPQCPGGGRYTLNAVSKAPTCSMPGHALQ